VIWDAGTFENGAISNKGLESSRTEDLAVGTQEDTNQFLKEMDEWLALMHHHATSNQHKMRLREVIPEINHQGILNLS